MAHYTNDRTTMAVTKSLALASSDEGGLICIRGTQIGKMIPLPPDRVVSFGRDASVSQIVMEDPQVSRIHCQITYVPALKKYRVVDVSTNGTFLGTGERLHRNQEYYLPPATELYMGNGDNLYKFR